MKPSIAVLSTFIVFAAVGCGGSSPSDGSVRDLTLPAGYGGQAFGISANFVLGRSASTADSSYGAAKWDVSTGIWTDLAPAGSENSAAYGANATKVVGEVGPAGGYHAGYWTGDASTFVDLNPSGSFQSGAYGISDSGTIVGYSRGFAEVRAGYWTGDASTFVDLNPAGFDGSVARSISGSNIVGHTQTPTYHAALWTGPSASSFVDLNPAGASSSDVFGVSGNVEVGTATIGSVTHAAMWTGTAASYVDLNPTGATDGSAAQIAGNYIAGTVRFGSVYHAILWNATSKKYLDLNSPTSLTNGSYAKGLILTSAGVTVCGYTNNKPVAWKVGSSALPK